jgi:SAM-dependent methyltransferase
VRSKAHTSIRGYKGCPKPESLLRRLQGSFLAEFRKTLAPETLMLDCANGSKRLGHFLGLPDSQIRVLNVLPGTDYTEDLEGDCRSVPRETFDLVTCTNYLLLAEQPRKAIENIYSFLKPGGRVLLDFASLMGWYEAHDGIHRHSFNPDSIRTLCDRFAEGEIVPVGNFMQAALYFYSRRLPRPASDLLKLLGACAGPLDRDPHGALFYFFVGQKGLDSSLAPDQL